MYPYLIAHGQEVIAVLFAFVSLGYVVSIVSLTCALGKKRHVISRVGFVSGVIGTVFGGWLLWLFGTPPDGLDLVWLVALLPLPISLAGLWLSLRHSKIEPLSEDSVSPEGKGGFR